MVVAAKAPEKKAKKAVVWTLRYLALLINDLLQRFPVGEAPPVEETTLSVIRSRDIPKGPASRATEPLQAVEAIPLRNRRRVKTLNKVSIGAVGLGGIFYGWGGHSGHLPAYPKLEQAKVCALCDANKDSLEKAAFWYRKVYEEESQKMESMGNSKRAEELREDASSIRLYYDFDEMLRRENLDLLDIMTPVRFHRPMAIRALDNGINVMCEKPMARTWLEAIEVVEAVKRSGRMFQYAENFIYSISWYNLRKFLISGIIGEPVAVFLPLAIGEPGGLTSSYWDPMVAGGGCLLDMAIHGITSTWFLLGFDAKPVRVKSAEPDGIGIEMPERIVDGVYRTVLAEDEAHFLVEFERRDGWTTVFLEGSWSYKDGSTSPIIMGTKGSIEFGSADKMVLIDHHGNRTEISYWCPSFLNRIPPLEPGGYLGELRNIVRCIIEGIEPDCNERVGAESMAIAGAAYLSEMRGRKPISLEEFKEYALKIQEREGERASEVLIQELTRFGGMKK